jgi:phosphate transport system protein
MPKQFDHDLNMLKERIIAMASVANQMVKEAVEALVAWKPGPFELVRVNEDKVDLMQRDIDEETIRMIGVYTPVAADLRFLLMATKIASELERIADKAVDVGFYSKSLFKEPPLKPLVDIPRMAEIASDMLTKSLDAFAYRSADKAFPVIAIDDQVDNLHDQIFRELMTYVLSDPKNIKRVLELVLIARAFERIADHVVNIAENVVYLVKGEDIRHLSSLNEARQAEKRD